MSDVLDLIVSELLENDVDNLYRYSLGYLGQRYSRLNKLRIATIKEEPDKYVLEATKVLIDAAIQFDTLYKQSNFEKESGLITNIMIKTLKISQKILAGLLLISPLKVGIAYNALHNVIKFLEKKKVKKV